MAERHETRRDTLAPNGLDSLRTEVAKLESEVGDLPEPTESIETLIARRDAAREGRNAAEVKQSATQAALAETDRMFVARETDLRRSREALDRETAAHGQITDPAEARHGLVEVLTIKQSTCDAAQRDVEALRQTVPDLASLTAVQHRAASVVNRSREETDALEKSISELNGSIGARAEEGIEEELAVIEGRQARAAERVAEIETEIATLTRLRDVLTAAKADAKEHFFEPVVKELKPLLEIVFGDAKVIFDENTLLPVSLERSGEVESFDVLSGGMREQITILTRLAFARLLAQDGRTVPVILDDALIYSDDDRIERMFNALHRQAMDLQILVFTCRQRAFHQLGGRALRMQEWSPELLT
jgi:DNA repair exonuclease SbcCD ATPase subunit